MIIENEEALDGYIICPQCYTLHQEVPIADGSRACCRECGALLYRYNSRVIPRSLALSITGLIAFMLANAFPLIQIDILGNDQLITILKTVVSLFDSGFYLIGFLSLFLVCIFPLMVFGINTILFFLLYLERGEEVSKRLLILLSYITPWNMADIFLISILVALVKLAAFGQIAIGIAFWALVVSVLVDIYLTKNIRLPEIWMLRKRIYGAKEKQ